MPPQTMAFSSNGTYFALGHARDAGDITVWETNDWNQISTVTDSNVNTPDSIAPSNDSQYLAATSDHLKIRARL